MAYDRADNDPSTDAVRIAFFVAWAMLNGLAGQLHLEDHQELLRQLHQRKITPRKFLEVACDDKFWEEDLSDDGNLFARVYYPQQRGLLNYFDDYREVFLTEYANLSSITDDWNDYDKIEAVVSGRYEQWKLQGTMS